MVLVPDNSKNGPSLIYMFHQGVSQDKNGNLWWPVQWCHSYDNMDTIHKIHVHVCHNIIVLVMARPKFNQGKNASPGLIVYVYMYMYVKIQCTCVCIL